MSALFKTEAYFRPMHEDDLDVMAAIDYAAYPFPWTRGNFGDSIASGYSCWVYQHDEFILGYAVMMLAAQEAHLLNITVAPNWQGQGKGRAFMLHLLEVARNYAAEAMFLEVRPTNTVARRLYHKLGFDHIAVRKDYYPIPNGREDAIIMRKELPHA
ncbi:ribosomal protein S18-alanine N-acetyltransferase [Sulfuriferula sp.]|uniref:ribosomal protein S18-alanine N-acetyltransferase n=1 Tax=Sulfuriferula sp. TaxID=2025307 RepID=UPI00273012B6|nr:ribosomal protein S18-alanine N-acetyltransferase [Sulfuriferula sp.]MDP2024913.1 ribosomal protein S18-alanine N-acetyltransferase [Sulfuriferula sp.]